MARNNSRILPMADGFADNGRRTRLYRWIAGGLLAIMALAWFDGGEEPIRPISVEIAVPEGR